MNQVTESEGRMIGRPNQPLLSAQAKAGLKKVPTLRGLPLLGSMLDFKNDRAALFERGYRELGPVFGLKLGPVNAVVLIGPEYQEQFFDLTDTDLSMHKTYRFLKAMFGPIAFAAPPETYYRHRPIFQQPFKGGKMAGYIRIMQQETQAWLDSLPDTGDMEIVSTLTALVQNIAAHCLMGEAFRNSAGDEFWKQYLYVGAALDPLLPPNLPLPKFLRRDRAKKKLNDMLIPLIRERREHPDQYDDFLQDFVTSRYDDGTLVEEETVIGLLLALMFAGHETTVGQTAWGVIQLLQHPDYLALLQRDINEHFPRGAALDGKTLRAMKHLQWAVDETTRLKPSSDMLIRKAEADIQVGDYLIPKGRVVFITPRLTQRLPDYFKNPNDYDPLRHAPERAEDKQHRFLIGTFGGGVHKCTGMNFATNEMLVIIGMLFQQFELSLVTTAPNVVYGMGACKPESTTAHFRRKPTG